MTSEAAKPAPKPSIRIVSPPPPALIVSEPAGLGKVWVSIVPLVAATVVCPAPASVITTTSSVLGKLSTTSSAEPPTMGSRPVYWIVLV